MINEISEFTYLPAANAILAVTSDNIFSSSFESVKVEGNSFAAWGADNNAPQQIISKVEKSDVMSANLNFNINVCYGLGPRLVKIIRDSAGKEINRLPVLEGKEFDFFEKNDIQMFMLETLTDMNFFHNSFAELIFDETFSEISSLRCKEAVFSRWQIDNKKNIVGHGYSAIWAESPSNEDVVISPVIDEFDWYNDLLRAKALKKKSMARLIYPIYMPSPGKPYYSRPSWYSLFESGWYDLNVSIPGLKKAILENQLGVKFIIYISPKYFEKLAAEEGIEENNLEGMKDLRNREVAKMDAFLAGGNGVAKSITSLQESIPTGSGSAFEKYISIEPIENKLSGGEFINDAETSANVICYAMGIHQSLIGAAPGKSTGSFSGTDKRELYLIKQALMKPLIERCLKVLSIIKKFNNWDKDIYIEIPEYIFTTLDKNKSGKEESVNNEV